MPFVDVDTIEAEVVAPKHSAAYGGLVTGEQIDVSRVRFDKRLGSER